MDLLLGVEEVSGTGMQIGDTHQVVVLEGLKDFLTDLAVQNLKEVIHAGVLIGHLQSVHQRSELSRGTGRNTGEVQTAELALLDGGALVAQFTGKVALDGDAAISLFVYQISEHLAGLAGDVLSVVAVGQTQNHSLSGRGTCRSSVASGRAVLLPTAAGAQAQQHDHRQKGGNKLFHLLFSYQTFYDPNQDHFYNLIVSENKILRNRKLLRFSRYFFANIQRIFVKIVQN